MSLRSLLKHRLTLQRATVSPSRGVAVKTWANEKTAVPCRVQQGKGQLNQGAANTNLEYDAIIFVRVQSLSDVQPNGNADDPDRIVITKHPVLTGTTYEVINAGDEDGSGKLLTIYVRRRQSGG